MTNKIRFFLQVTTTAFTPLCLAAETPATLETTVTYHTQSPFIRPAASAAENTPGTGAEIATDTGSTAAVFPETAFLTDIPGEWHAAGHTDGNRIGVRPAKDPETGAPLTEFFFDSRNLKKRWLHWQKKFPAPLDRAALGGISFEVFPLTPIPASLRLQVGLPLAVKDIGPAYQTTFGQLIPGRWNRIETRAGSNRHPHPSGIRILLDISRPDVPQKQEVRFLVRNLRPLEGGAVITQPPSVPAAVSEPVSAVWIQQTSPAELLITDAVSATLDIAVAHPVQAVLQLAPAATTTPSPVLASASVELRPPVTRIAFRHAPPATAPFAPGPHALQIVLAAHQNGTALPPLLLTTRPLTFTAYAPADFLEKLAAARARSEKLRARADALAAQAIAVAEPGITLETADLFLHRFIPDDWNRQKERAIAHTLLRQTETLLDKAARELDERAARIVVEKPVPNPYDPAAPIKTAPNGRLRQNGNPILLFGSQMEPSQFADNALLPRLGFNSVLIEIPASAYKKNTLLTDCLRTAERNRLAVHLLFSTHYMKNLPTSAHAGHVMLPYDILDPRTRPLLASAYEDVLPPLAPFPNLVSVGTANEPGYTIGQQAANYETAFRQWLAVRDNGDIARVNARWHTAFPSIEAVTLPQLLSAKNTPLPPSAGTDATFAARPGNPAARLDWELFRTETLAGHFRFMRDNVRQGLPEGMVWVKKYHRIGYDQIDPEALYDAGATSHNWSSISNPFYSDYARGIDRDAPLGCTEWKLVPGHTPDTLDTADSAAGPLLMFENYARGLSYGIVWKWSRRDWRNAGDHHTYPRYPLATEALGRASLRLQQLAPVFDRLATLGDGPVALLFDKNSHLAQGEKAYQHDEHAGIESLYWRLNRNSGGVRILHAGRATVADFSSRRLIAAGTANALDVTTMRHLYDWVAREGGTLWLTAPGTLASDPWGAPHTDPGFTDLIAAASKPGEHALGKGRVVVDPAWAGYEQFLSGPYPINTDDSSPVIRDVECRYVAPTIGKAGYVYVLNRTSNSRRIQLRDSTTQKIWSIPANATEIWQQRSQSPATDSLSTLAPYEVLLFEIPSS
ncbi:hypothetical protein OPIT5_15650 [Opitutaceae bacterium TAV5]|nr:hypothetical protein OPIT5_15650 [Opitutaceae bacterium TAV5]